MRAPAQRLAIRALMDLPTPILRALSGGAAVYREGRTLDPRIQFLSDAARRRPALHTLPPAEARGQFDHYVRILGGRAPKGVRTEFVSAAGADGARPARLYRPHRQDPGAPLLLYAHAGGGVLGGPETDEALCGALAEALQAPVLSIDYRLAPEHRFPAAFEDLYAAFLWARETASRFGAPSGQVAVGGASVGGGLAAALCLRLKAERQAQPTLQVLLYPAVDLACEAASIATFGDLPPLNTEMMSWLLAQYVGSDINPADPRLSPLRATDLTGLAPAVVATAGFDPLVDQGDAYARRLMDAGVPTVWRRYDALCHGFACIAGAAPSAEAACRDVAALAAGLARG
jgi:acetyl esterase